MEVVETHALSSFDHSSIPSFPYATAAIENPEHYALVPRSPELTGYSDPPMPEGFGSPDAGGGNKCQHIGDGMPDNGQACDAGGDIKARKLERCTSDAAMKVQKVYRSYRTRRMLADSAVVAEELWFVILILLFYYYYFNTTYHLCLVRKYLDFIFLPTENENV